RLRAAATASPGVDGDAHARLDWPGRRVAGWMPLVPAELRGAPLEIRPPHRVRRFRRQVLDPELDGVHLHAVGELLHQDFRDEAALRVTGCSHRSLLTGVYVDVLVRSATVGELIDVRQREASGRAGAAGAPRVAF